LIILISIFQENDNSEIITTRIEKIMCIEILISIIFSIAFIVKIKDSEKYLNNDSYGYIYITIDLIAGPASLFHDLLFIWIFS